MDAVVEAPRSRAMQPQPLELVNIPGTLLNIRTVEILVGFKKSKIAEEIKAGRFPPSRAESATCKALAFRVSNTSASSFKTSNQQAAKLSGSWSDK